VPGERTGTTEKRGPTRAKGPSAPRKDGAKTPGRPPPAEATGAVPLGMGETKPEGGVLLRSGDAALWYKDAVIYELHVRAFADSDGDGIGDFRGLITKLDYLQDLGVTAIWLLPFYPSPLRDDGYDISNYTDIHPAYGTLRDFKQLLREARRQGLRVITELVINHTSDQHPWFQRARRAKRGSSARNFYVWSDTPERYKDARIIFKDFESSNWAWDPVAGQYYWHRFYSHQPDLNFDNREVRRAIFSAMDFWLDMGIDGLRLDAIPYLFEREGTNCENLPETHQFLKDLRRHVDRNHSNRMFLAEANQWPEDAVNYFGKGDECHMAFHFPLMPRMFMSIRQEERFPIIDILGQTPPIPESCQWAVFLRNHDELTLEMVTDEERDYMYRSYAGDPQARINLGIRRRLSPLLSNNRRMIEMMNGLLFSLPGTPVLYYGDEIGMGDNIYLGDRNGVRSPMQWSSDRNAGFSRANPQKLYLPVIIDPEYHAEALNVEAQQNNPHSLLWWTKRLISLRKEYRAFGRGSLEMLFPDNRRVLAFFRSYEDERILVLANLSHLVQYVELDLSAYEGMTPVELFGRSQFPRIGELPYFLTLGPYAFYWFSLEKRPEQITVGKWQPPTLSLEGETDVFGKKGLEALEEILPAYLMGRRWFGGKGRTIKSTEIVEQVPITGTGRAAEALAQLTLVSVEYTEGEPDTYVMTLGAEVVGDNPELEQRVAHTVLARFRNGDGETLVYDALWDPRFTKALLHAVERRRRFKGAHGELIAAPTRAFKAIMREGRTGLEPNVMGAEQSNTSVAFGNRAILKIVRRTESGVNPDLEIGRFLTSKGFPHTSPTIGGIEYLPGGAGTASTRRSRAMSLSIIQGYVPNEGDAWRYTLDGLRGYLDNALSRHAHEEGPPRPQSSLLLDLAESEPPELAYETIGGYLESARLLGQRTAEMHLALASDAEDPAFAPESFTQFYQRSLYQSMRALTIQVFQVLRRRAKDIPQAVQILDLEREVIGRFHALLDRKIAATRIRCHGDYHLGQVLYTGKDFIIIDFEGEPARPLSERRIKRPAMKDVAGMIRSFHYAAYSVALGGGSTMYHEKPSILEPWLDFWYAWVSASFLRSYQSVAAGASFLPSSRAELEVLLDAFLLEKALYELGYEVNNRPDWVKIPIQGILDLVERTL
jgi:maltose alpha-D-glucosyltransferase / alpha-amylase